MKILPLLKKHFKFDQIFDLAIYCEDMDLLYKDLQKLTKEEYESNYRFIFLHYDTDYYISNDQPGLFLRNLQRILNDLGIPNYFCLILTEQDIQPELNRLCIEETRDTTPIACIQHSCQDLLYSQPVVGVSLSADAISHKFMSLNKIRRFHRTLLFGFLKYNNLLNYGIVSYCKKEKLFNE